jgi:hypothetical protein
MGVLLGTSTVTIPAGGQVMIQTSWQPMLPDTHEIEVSVSPHVFENEASYANNLAADRGLDSRPISGQLWLAQPLPNPSSGLGLLLV